MKKFKLLSYLILITGFVIVDFSSCTKQVFEEKDVQVVSPSEKTVTKALEAVHETPYFDWEDTSYVYIAHYQKVLLPWVSGASGDIPSYIKNDYRRSQGWEMVYNICSDDIINENGHKNYLIFYNKITGVLRVFYYMRDLPTGIAKDSFAHFSSEPATRLWNFNQGMFSALPESSCAGAYIPNRTNSPAATALCNGWNCFDIELAYDPSGDDSKYFSIGLINQVSFDFKLKGIMAGSATGSLAFPSSASTGTPSFQQYATSAIETLQSISQIIDTTSSKDNKPSQAKVSATTVITVASAAINIVNSLYGLFKQSISGGTSDKPTSTDNLTISMDAVVNAEGSIESQTPAQASSISHLHLPGTVVSSSDVVAPHYNERLGAWNIASTPTVYLDNEYTPRVYEVQSGPSWSRQYGENYERHHILGGVSVSVNPETLKCIKGYDYTVTYYYLYKYDGEYYGRTLTGVDAKNLYCSDPKQYLKKCIYEEPLSEIEQKTLKNRLLEQLKTYGVKEVSLNEEQKLKTIIYKVDNESADKIINDPNAFTISVQNSYNYSQTRAAIKSKVKYPSATEICTDYVAKVQMVFHIKDEYGGGDFVSVKTFRPDYSLRNVPHTVDNFLPYYLRPEKETDLDRWNHRWDWMSL